MTTSLRIKRQYAEWLEDAVDVLVLHGNPTDVELEEAFDDIYAAAFKGREVRDAQDVTIPTAGGHTRLRVAFAWTDENKSDLEGIDDEIEIERNP